MTCQVCCDSFTQLTRSEISCPRQVCLFTCCKNCLKTYFTTSANNPHCMNCKFEFEDTFIIEHINRTFFKTELKKKQTDILLQIEKSRIPQTQEQAKHVLYLENREKIRHEVLLQKRKIQKEYEVTLRELKENHLISIDSLDQMVPPIVSKEKAEKTFTVRCQYDDCKGFLSSSYKCGICDKYTCHKCFDGIGLYNKIAFEKHVCDKGKVESVQMIKKETRSCPVCSTRISKIEGCDQMWCTNCNNAFSWKTGLIQTGAVHNPHYFDYLKKQTGVQPRNPLDIQCGGIPVNLFHHTLHLAHGNSKKEVAIIEKNIGNIHQLCLHLEHTRVPYNLNEKLEELRILYILNRLPLEKWKEKIYTAHMLDKKKKFEWDMYDIVMNVGGDLLRNYEKNVTELKPSKDNIHILKDYVLNVIVKQFTEIITYVNEIKMNKAKIYKNKANIISMCIGKEVFIKNTFTDYQVVNYAEIKVDPL